MGVDIRYTTEKFELISELVDDKNIFYQLFENTGVDSEKFPNIVAIDLYGNTVFNQRQLPILIKEFGALLNLLKEGDEAKWLMSVVGFLKNAQGKVHTYVMFVGD